MITTRKLRLSDEYSLTIKVKSYEGDGFFLLMPEATILTMHNDHDTSSVPLVHGITNINDPNYKLASDEIAIIVHNNILFDKTLVDFMPIINDDSNLTTIFIERLLHMVPHSYASTIINLKNLHWLLFFAIKTIGGLEVIIIDPASILQQEQPDTGLKKSIGQLRSILIFHQINVTAISIDVQGKDHSCGFWTIACLERAYVLINNGIKIDKDLLIGDINTTMQRLDLNDYKTSLLARIQDHTIRSNYKF